MSTEPPKQDLPIALERDIQIRKPLVFKSVAARNNDMAQAYKDAAAWNPKSATAKKFTTAAKTKKFKQARYDKNGTTALYRASAAGDLRTVKKLLKEGYDPGQPCRDNVGETPLMAAGRQRGTPVVAALIACGAKVTEDEIHIAINYTIGHCKSQQPAERADMALIDGWLAQGNSRAALSPFLHDAALANDLPLVEKLVQSGANIHHRRDWARPYSTEKGSFTPIMCAIGGEGNNIDMVRGMLALGADAQQARNYALARRQMGDDVLESTPMGALLTAAASGGKILTSAEAKAAAHEGLVDDMLKNPPPGLKYSGRKIDRKAVEAHIKRYRR